MTYSLEFNTSAKEEWDKLDGLIKQQFKAKLAERVVNPHVPAARLHSLPDCCKIKLKQAGYRLVYQVDNARITVLVHAVGKREGSQAYRIAKHRLS